MKGVRPQRGSGTGDTPIDAALRAAIGGFMECPICQQSARFVATPAAFDGRRITCARCGTYDVSRVVLDRGLLDEIELSKRREVLQRARNNAVETTKPLITTYLL